MRSVPWDGYFKYFQPKVRRLCVESRARPELNAQLQPEYKQRRQQVFTRQLLKRFNLDGVVSEFKHLAQYGDDVTCTASTTTTDSQLTPTQLQSKRIEQLQAVSRRRAMSENTVVS